jgi:hypothetical protein
MFQTAYVKYLLQITQGDKDCLALQLAHDCCEQNPQAIDLVAATGDKAFTRHTFYKAAKLKLEANDNDKQKCVPAPC